MISATSSNLIDGSLLMLLMERPDHAYTLLDRVEGLGLDLGSDLRILYRRLHSLEQRGLIEHRSTNSNKGPQRKVYRTTQSGARAVHDWATSLRFTYAALTHWLDGHSGLLDVSSHWQETVAPVTSGAPRDSLLARLARDTVTGDDLGPLSLRSTEATCCDC
jgi:DNA-binding PadR family transcriptional regulator